MQQLLLERCLSASPFGGRLQAHHQYIVGGSLTCSERVERRDGSLPKAKNA